MAQYINPAARAQIQNQQDAQDTADSASMMDMLSKLYGIQQQQQMALEHLKALQLQNAHMATMNPLEAAQMQASTAAQVSAGHEHDVSAQHYQNLVDWDPYNLGLQGQEGEAKLAEARTKQQYAGPEAQAGIDAKIAATGVAKAQVPYYAAETAAKSAEVGDRTQQRKDRELALIMHQHEMDPKNFPVKMMYPFLSPEARTQFENQDAANSRAEWADIMTKAPGMRKQDWTPAIRNQYMEHFGAGNLDYLQNLSDKKITDESDPIMTKILRHLKSDQVSGIIPTPKNWRVGVTSMGPG